MKLSIVAKDAEGIKINNVNDLVLECDEILKWDGTKYQLPFNSMFKL
jgi:hypothetical protein